MLQAGLAHDLQKLVDQAMVLGNADKGVRRDQTPYRMLPADQGFQRNGTQAGGADLRLKPRDDLAIIERLAQLRWRDGRLTGQFRLLANAHPRQNAGEVFADEGLAHRAYHQQSHRRTEFFAGLQNPPVGPADQYHTAGKAPTCQVSDQLHAVHARHAEVAENDVG